MKKLILSLSVAAFFTGASAQSCKEYYFLQNNKTVEITTYSKKGTETGKVVHKITDVKKAGADLMATLNTEMFDKKGKSTAKAVNNVKCGNGALMMDMKMFISPEQSQQINAEAKSSDVYLSYPASMKVGDNLPDGTFTMDIQQDNGMKSSIAIDITERKVEAQEQVTTPAGTWNCYKITYKSKIKISIAGIGIPVKSDVTEWYAPGFGVVKTESKWGSSVLTKFE
jgi:hypothetical protein